MTADIHATVALDYKIVDGTETVLFRSRTAASTFAADVSLPYTDGQDYTAREIAAGNGLFALGDKRWLLPADPLKTAGYTPKPGDEVQDDTGQVWVLKEPITLDELKVQWSAASSKGRS